MAMGGRDWVLLLTLSLIWGGAFLFNEVALVDLGPLTVVLGRVGFGAMALVIWLYAGGGRLPADARVWGTFLVMGVLNNVIPFSLIVWGQVSIDSGLASILNATTPLFIVVFAHVVTTDERMTPARLAGVLLGFAGVAVLIGPALLLNLGDGVAGQLAVLGAACAYACAGLYGRRLRGLPPLVAATGMVMCSALVMTPIALLVESPWRTTPGVAALGAVAGLSVLGTAMAYWLYFRILRTAGATNLMLVTFLIPVSAVLLGALVLGERLAWTSFAGMALIFAGLAAVDGHVLRMVRSMGGRKAAKEV
ncbi:MAG TPA: DMT family transporter [Kiloniellales bacterium]|jgi:drug/metabolite transporter (DMT)-like permease